MSKSMFVPGLRLCQAFYLEAVKPLLDEAYPGLRYTAARLGPGSEVLGFDTERSIDHDWGPRLELFLAPEDLSRYQREISQLLSQRLPKVFHGWPTNFEPPGGRVRTMAPAQGPVAHRVLVAEVGAWCAEQLGYDPRGGPTTLDWLATPGQRLAEVTGGAVFHDGIGELTTLRSMLSWYPESLWRYLLACQWKRIGEEEAFVARAAEAGDRRGSRMIAARLSRELMRLCLLLGRRFPPYSKWLGTAFAALSEAQDIATALDEALGGSPAVSQAGLCTAYELAGQWQNRLGLAEPVEATRRPFFNRPYLVIDAGRFAAALLARIDDPEIAALPPVGAVDQFCDSAEVLCSPRLARAVTRAACDSNGSTGR
jgi:Domain of unknown function (DUF4037)